MPFLSLTYFCSERHPRPCGRIYVRSGVLAAYSTLSQRSLRNIRLGPDERLAVHGPVILRSFLIAPGWSPGGRRTKARLEHAPRSGLRPIFFNERGERADCFQYFDRDIDIANVEAELILDRGKQLRDRHRIQLGDAAYQPG